MFTEAGKALMAWIEIERLIPYTEPTSLSYVNWSTTAQNYISNDSIILSLYLKSFIVEQLTRATGNSRFKTAKSPPREVRILSKIPVIEIITLHHHVINILFN